MSLQLNKHFKLFAALLFFSLLLFNVLAYSFVQPYRLLGYITNYLTLYLTFFILLYFFCKNRGFDRKYSLIYIGIGLFSSANIFTHLYNGNFQNNDALAFFILCLCFIIAVVKINWAPKHLFFFGHISIIIILLLFAHWSYLDFVTVKFESIFTNPNVLGSLLFSLMFFPIASLKYSRTGFKIYFLIGIALNIILIYATTARAILLSLAVILFARAILLFSKKAFACLFYIIMSFNYLFVSLYSILAKSEYANLLNEWSRERFNKNFFSGRQNIWDPALQYGMESPIIGHNIKILPQAYMEGTRYVHSHNQYLQIFLESGIVGLACFTLFLYFIWRIYQKGIESNIVQWSACFFLGILLYQNMEISLFFNLSSIGLIHWFIICIGVSSAVKRSYSYTELK